ncbi:MAG: flagellar protein FlgN [Desulfobacteraceae bacterium]
MKPKTRELIDILEQEHQLYESLLDRLQREKAVMLGSQARQLTRLTEEKQALSARLATLETRRQSVLNRIAGELNLPAGQLTLRMIARHADSMTAERIVQVRQALIDVTRAVREANEESRCLVQHCLGLVQGSLSFLRQLISPPPVYGASGGIVANAQNGHFMSGQY